MKDEIKFEDAIKRLEEIVRELESEKFDLDKSIELFEEGIKLSKFCKKKLDESEQKIEVILKKEDEEGTPNKDTYDIKPLFEVFPENKNE